jgi:hypothetical protein
VVKRRLPDLETIADEMIEYHIRALMRPELLQEAHLWETSSAE